MKQLAIAALIMSITLPAVAKTHKEMFDVSCKTLWPAVKDTIRNSGKYGVIGIDNEDMAASYNIGGYLGGKRVNSVILNSKGADSCELQVQTSYSGLIHDDEGDFKQRVQKSLATLAAEKTVPSASASSTPAK